MENILSSRLFWESQEALCDFDEDISESPPASPLLCQDTFRGNSYTINMQNSPLLNTGKAKNEKLEIIKDDLDIQFISDKRSSAAKKSLAEIGKNKVGSQYSPDGIKISFDDSLMQDLDNFSGKQQEDARTYDVNTRFNHKSNTTIKDCSISPKGRSFAMKQDIKFLLRELVKQRSNSGEIQPSMTTRLQYQNNSRKFSSPQQQVFVTMGDIEGCE